MCGGTGGLVCVVGVLRPTPRERQGRGARDCSLGPLPDQRDRTNREIEARPADDRFTYPRIVLAHGFARVTSTLAWIDDAATAIQQQTAEPAPG
jgi:hypothetical protein